MKKLLITGICLCLILAFYDMPMLNASDSPEQIAIEHMDSFINALRDEEVGVQLRDYLTDVYANSLRREEYTIFSRHPIISEGVEEAFLRAYEEFNARGYLPMPHSSKPSHIIYASYSEKSNVLLYSYENVLLTFSPDKYFSTKNTYDSYMQNESYGDVQYVTMHNGQKGVLAFAVKENARPLASCTGAAVQYHRPIFSVKYEDYLLQIQYKGEVSLEEVLTYIESLEIENLAL